MISYHLYYRINPGDEDHQIENWMNKYSRLVIGDD
jgi:hypothetical protein